MSLSKRAFKTFKKRLQGINDTAYDANAMKEIEERYERLDEEARKIGLNVLRDHRGRNPTFILYHNSARNESTYLIEDASLDDIEEVLPRIKRTLQIDGYSERYEIVEPEVRKSGQTRGPSSGHNA